MADVLDPPPGELRMVVDPAGRMWELSADGAAVTRRVLEEELLPLTFHDPDPVDLGHGITYHPPGWYTGQPWSWTRVDWVEYRRLAGG